MDNVKSYILRNRPSFKYIFFLVFSFLFVLVNSEASSPWKEIYPLDSSMFIIIGREILQGKILYKEIYDHKGPILFLLEALCQFFISGRSGVFYMEILTVFLSICFIFKTTILMSVNKLLSYSSVLFFLLVLRYLYGGGNTNEMYALPSFFISFYLLIIIHQQEYIGVKKVRTFFILGILFSFNFWIRANNALPLLAIPCFLFFKFIVNKDYNAIYKLICGYILSQFPLMLIFSFYFFYNDAFFDFIHATFLVNISYVGSYFELSPYFMQYNLLLFLLFLSNLMLCIMKKCYTEMFFVITLFILTLFTANIYNKYNLHYFILFIFAFVVYLIVLFKVLSSIKYSKVLSAFIFIFLCLFFTRNMYYQIVGTWATKEYYEDKANLVRNNLHNIIDIIPENELSTLYPYDMLPDIFLLSNIPVSYKYFTLQDMQAKLSPHIYDDLIELFSIESSSPKWLLTMKKDQEISSILELDSIMKTNYVLHNTDGYYFLYKKKKIE